METWSRKDFLTLQSWVGEHTSGLGELLRDAAGPRELFNTPDARLEALPPRTRKVLHRARRHWPRANGDGARWRESDAAFDFLPIVDAAYPALLRSIPDPPPWLYCRGDQQSLRKPAVAIVGSRRASRAGLQAAGDLAERLARAGYTVCSGLALGIDGAAHRGALRGGCTVAVLASGIDRPSPQRNLELASAILGNGCLVSELPPGTAPDRHRFPRRNRIISGMARATIVVEAALPSGTLHTATAALEQGRDVMVLPWSVYHPGGAGCLRLLRDGATPITAMEELESYFPGLDQSPASSGRSPPGERGEILAHMGDGALSADELGPLMDRDLASLLVVLAEMELEGWIIRDEGRYRRRPQGTL